jgi:hypothetical protein
MCASEQFHRGFSSFDYDARRDFCVFEYRGKISETLTAAASGDGCTRSMRAPIIRSVVRVSLKKPQYAG